MHKLIAVIAALLIGASAASAQIAVDLGELGTVTLATQLIPVAKAVLDDYRPPAQDENGDVIPWTNADYKAHMEEFILDRGWKTLQKYVERKYFEMNPVTKPDITQYMVLTPPA